MWLWFTRVSCIGFAPEFAQNCCVLWHRNTPQSLQFKVPLEITAGLIHGAGGTTAGQKDGKWGHPWQTTDVLHCRSTLVLTNAQRSRQQNAQQRWPGHEAGVRYEEGLLGTPLTNGLDVCHEDIHQTSRWPEYEDSFQLGDLVYCSFQDSVSLGTTSPLLFKLRDM